MEELLERFSGPATHFRMPGFFVVAKFAPHLFIESRQQIEGDICRLKMVRIGVRNVVAKTAERCLARKLAGLITV
jgi:hypothetical protein